MTECNLKDEQARRSALLSYGILDSEPEEAFALCKVGTKGRDLSSGQVALLQDLSCLVVDELELGLLTNSDSLKDTLNRREFYATGNKEIQRALRYRKPLCCLTFALDQFKSINSRFGHTTCDLVLQHVVTVCKNELRDVDLIGRISGETFAVLLPGTMLIGAFNVAERLVKTVARSATEVGGHNVGATLSMGVAEYVGPSRTIDDLVRAADAAMHDAKECGCNRAICYWESDLKVLNFA